MMSGDCLLAMGSGIT